MQASFCFCLAFTAIIFTSCIAETELINEDELDFARGARAWNPPELIKVGKYWRAYAKRRLEALDRCERRLSAYVGRLKMAQDILGGLAKRNTNADTSEIKTLKQETSLAEINLNECVNQISQQQADDLFYRDYQILSNDVQRLTDQVSSCIEAGGTVSPGKRQAVDLQILPESSPQMRRVYENLKLKKDVKLAEKTECFSSLGIPSNFPVQLE